MKPLSVEIRHLTPDTVDQLRRIHSVTFGRSLHYNDSFYREIVASLTNSPSQDIAATTTTTPTANCSTRSHRLPVGRSLCRLAFYKGTAVGAICARIQERDDDDDDDKESSIFGGGEEHDRMQQKEELYVMTLAVLAAYRGRSIGSQLLQSVLDDYSTSLLMKKKIVPSSPLNSTSSSYRVSLHVQVSNTDAIRFYTERCGFTCGPLVRNYYRRLQPPDCFVLYKLQQQQQLTT